MKVHSRFLTIAALAFSLGTSGCLFRSHKVQSNISQAPLITASQQQLIDRLNEMSNAIRTLNTSVDIATTVGGAKKGKVTQYSEISGYILAEKPAKVRMIGLFPIVRNRAFDMVSNGQEFELWIPAKNKFIIGPTEVNKPSPNALENLRPQIVLDSLLFRPVQPDEIAVLEGRLQQVTDEDSKRVLEQPNYVLDIIHRETDNGQWYLTRKIYFDRTNLLPYRQLMFDRQGEIATDARYSNFQKYDGYAFPMKIVIQRPQEEYMIGLKIVKLTVNQSLTPDQFILQQPPGAQIVHLDANGHATTTTSAQVPPT